MLKVESGDKIFYIDERFKDLNLPVVYRLSALNTPYSYVGITDEPASRGKGHLCNIGANIKDLVPIFGKAEASYVNPTNKFKHVKSKNYKEWSLEILEINENCDDNFHMKEGQYLQIEMETNKKVINSHSPSGLNRDIFVSIGQYDKQIGFYN